MLLLTVLTMQKLQQVAVGSRGTQAPLDEAACIDESVTCTEWAKSGECERNAGYMKTACPVACGVCVAPPGAPTIKKGSCKDQNVRCATWAAIGECDTNPGFMKTSCPVTCRLCQSDSCFDAGENCTARSANAGCFTDPTMLDECAWTCLACELAHGQPGCVRAVDVAPAAVAGTVNSVFNAIVAPSTGEGLGPGMRVTVHSRSPWVVTIDDFLSDAEADALLKAGAQKGTGWQRSQAGDGVLEARTSSTSWCRGGCVWDDTVERVSARIEALTGVPTQNCEYLQECCHLAPLRSALRSFSPLLLRGGGEAGERRPTAPLLTPHCLPPHPHPHPHSHRRPRLQPLQAKALPNSVSTPNSVFTP